MTRQLLALIALLSGLTVLTGQANASAVQSVACEIGVAADAAEISVAQRHIGEASIARRALVSASGAVPLAACAACRAQPPVRIGVDRAYE